MAAPVKECKVYFNPIQEGSGDPSPDNVRVISGWNNISIHKTGKNLIDENYLANANNYPNSGDYGYHYTNDIQLIPNTRYRFVWYNYDNTPLSEFGVTSINLYVRGANEYIVNNTKYRQYSSGFLTPSTGIIRFGIYHPSALQRQDVLNAIFNNGKLMLQIGTDDIAYESYSGTTVQITFPSEAGTVYGGYVDLVNGEIIKNWNFYTITGEETFYESGDWVSIFVPSGMQATDDASLKMAGFCSHYPYRAYSRGKIGVMYNERTITLDGSMRDAAGWKAYCQEQYNNGTPITLCYPLKTPIHYPIDPQTLKTLRGTNNIWSNANGNIELSYWKH